MQPQWIKDFKAGKIGAGTNQPGTQQVKEQFTVIRKTPVVQRPIMRPMSSGDGMSWEPLQRPEISQQQPSPAQPIPQPLSAPSRLTGAGVDGQVQPNKMTGQVHEGEGVINANAMQSLTPEEFAAFSKALETGALDKNTFRKSIALQPITGYATGGIVKKLFNSNLTSQNDRGAAEDIAKASQPQSISAPPPAPLTATPTIRKPAAPAPEPTPIAPIQMESAKPSAAPVAQTITAASVPKSPTTPKPLSAQVTPVTPISVETQAPAQEQTVTAAPTIRQPSTSPTPLQVQTVTPDKQTNYEQLFTNTTGQNYQKSAAQAQEGYDNSQLQRGGAAQAAAAAAAAQELNQAGVGAAGKATQSAELARTQNAAMDNLRSNLSNQFTGNMSTFNNIDIAQRQQGMNETQKAIDNKRYDEEKFLANNRYADETAYNRNITADTTKYNREQDAIRNARLDKTNQTAEQTANQSNMENRLGMLFNSGSTLASAQTDSTLQSLVKTYLGENATPEQIANEIAMMYSSATTNNLDTFNANSEKFIGAAIDNKKPLEEILNDQNIRRNISGKLGPNATPEQINKEISDIYTELNKSDAERIFDNFSENWVSNDIKQVPGWDTDLKQTISDLYLKGVVDADGNIKEGAVFDWPWEDPDTMFKYKDWNGNSTSGGTYDQTQAVKVDGNGTTYVNAEGKAVTMADTNKVWNTLSSSDRSLFIKDGAMDTAAFMKKYFPTTKDASGNTVSVTTRDDFTSKVISDDDYLDTVNKTLNEFQSGGVYPGTPGDAKTPNAGLPIPSGSFIYYDANGDAQVTGKSDSNKLAYIYQQLSDKYNKGNSLTSGQFSEYWGDGKKWRIADDGTILNIDKPGEDVKAPELPGIKKLDTWDQYSSNNFDEATVSSLSKLSTEDRAKNPLFVATNSGWGEFFIDDINSPLFTNNKTKRLSDEGIDWIKSNLGKLYRSSDGNVYQILGNNNDNGEAHLLMRDMKTGDVVKQNLKTGDNYTKVGTITSGQYGNFLSTLKDYLADPTGKFVPHS
jgi:hypothetical protein